MDEELRALEEKIGQLVALAQRLRVENVELRRSLLAAQGENKALHANVENASARLQRLLDRLPEEAA